MEGLPVGIEAGIYPILHNPANIGPEPYWHAARVGFDLMLPNGICQVRPPSCCQLAGTGEVSRLA